MIYRTMAAVFAGVLVVGAAVAQSAAPSAAQAGDELYHDGRCDLGKRRRENIEFHGGGKECGPAGGRWREFSGADRAERRQAIGSALGMSAGFQA